MLSRTHPIARRLRALKVDARLREDEGVLLAEGVHLAKEALASGAVVEFAVVSRRLSESVEGRALVLRLREAGVLTHVSSEATLDGLQDTRSPQPVVLVVRHAMPDLESVLDGRGGTPLLVVACGVQEPGNLGALLRTADAAAATGFVAAPGSASLTHPRVVRASMGAIFRLPAVAAPLDELLEAVERRRLRRIGAEARNAVAYDQADWSGPIALFLGGEGAGLPPAVRESLDAGVAVPMAPSVESLSVNAAAAVLLFEAARKRQSISRA